MKFKWLNSPPLSTVNPALVTCVLENPKKESLSYKSTNRCKHSTNKGTNRLPHVSKLQVTNAGLVY